MWSLAGGGTSKQIQVSEHPPLPPLVMLCRVWGGTEDYGFKLALLPQYPAAT